jgi:hypothetical protein
VLIAASAVFLAAPAQGREWLAGDLHVHTCFSHDAWCPPDDDNTGPDEFYTLSTGVRERFAQAALQGLDYLAITDHNDVRSSSDPGFGRSDVIGIPGYEASFDGHAQMLGAERLYPAGGESAAEVAGAAAALRADGGVFQVNHPGYRPEPERRFADCSDVDALDWGYGYELRPDTIEILNPTSPAQTALAWWECWLERGERIGATGGSDTHWIWTAPVHGPGNPTTWVLADTRDRESVLAALRAGRTAVSRRTPLTGGGPLLLEADADGDGRYEAVVGDEVPAGSRLRVRMEGLPGGGFVRVRANGRTLADDAPLLPGRPVEVNAPAESGWVRAAVYAAPATSALTPECDPALADSISLCPHDFVLEALTSPIYLR